VHLFAIWIGLRRIDGIAHPINFIWLLLDDIRDDLGVFPSTVRVSATTADEESVMSLIEDENRNVLTL